MRRLGGSGFAERIRCWTGDGSPASRGRNAAQQLVQDGAQGVDVRPGVDVLPRGGGLLRAHVGGGAHLMSVRRHRRRIGGRQVDRLGHPEVDDLGARLIAGTCHEDVGRLEIAVDDPLLVRVLDAVAHLDEQVQPLPDRQTVPVTELVQRNSLHVFHGEVGAPLAPSSRPRGCPRCRDDPSGPGPDVPLRSAPGSPPSRCRS